MFQKYCLFVHYFVARLPASEFMAVRSCYNFSSLAPSRIQASINADCKTGVYAYHWKNKRCTIKMRDEYLSSQSSFRWGWRAIIFRRCMRRISLGGRSENKAFCVNHILLIIFTLGGGGNFKMAGIFSNLLDLSWSESAGNLIAFCISCREKFLIKIRAEPFSDKYKNLFVEYIQSRMCIEDKSLDIFCHIIKFRRSGGVFYSWVALKILSEIVARHNLQWYDASWFKNWTFYLASCSLQFAP